MKENVNELTFYQELADLMNGHPDQYETDRKSVV